MSTSCSRESRSRDHDDHSLRSDCSPSSSRASTAMSGQGTAVSARSSHGSSTARGSTRSTNRTASASAATKSASSSRNTKSKSVTLSQSLLDEETRKPEKIDRVLTPGFQTTEDTRVAMPFGFSNSHPMIPRRYVPPWQLDMKNRKLTIENCKKAEIDTWEGHTSHFLEKRERMAVTSHKPYAHVLSDGRRLKSIDSHLSKYNSSMLYFN